MATPQDFAAQRLLGRHAAAQLVVHGHGIEGGWLWIDCQIGSRVDRSWYRWAAERQDWETPHSADESRNGPMAQTK